MFNSLHLDLIVESFQTTLRKLLARATTKESWRVEEVCEDEEAGAVDQDTGQPEAVGALGEKEW